MDPKKKESNWVGNGLWALGGFVLGFGAGFITSDMMREAELAQGVVRPAVVK